MKKLLVTLMGVGLALPVWAQTNYVYVVNDDTAACSSAFDSGLLFGGTVGAVLLGFWMIRTIPGGGDSE